MRWPWQRHGPEMPKALAEAMARPWPTLEEVLDRIKPKPIAGRALDLLMKMEPPPRSASMRQNKCTIRWDDGTEISITFGAVSQEEK